MAFRRSHRATVLGLNVQFAVNPGMSKLLFTVFTLLKIWALSRSLLCTEIKWPYFLI